jgi:hypothetical protein
MEKWVYMQGSIKNPAGPRKYLSIYDRVSIPLKSFWEFLQRVAWSNAKESFIVETAPLGESPT